MESNRTFLQNRLVHLSKNKPDLEDDTSEQYHSFVPRALFLSHNYHAYAL